MKRSLILVFPAQRTAIALNCCDRLRRSIQLPERIGLRLGGILGCKRREWRRHRQPDDASASGHVTRRRPQRLEQIIATMSEFYKRAATPVGEQLYYAGAGGAGAIFVLIVPESNLRPLSSSVATVGEDKQAFDHHRSRRRAAPSPLPS